MTKHQKGFTIIEVSLVIAIAGLIFTMIFIALPALQRNQRDTARRENLSEFISAVKKYQSNNRGALPSGTGTFEVISGVIADNGTEWPSFYNKYLGRTFSDPNGTYYTIRVIECKGEEGKSISPDTSCYIAPDSIPEFSDYTIVVFTQATCDGETAKSTSNPRNLAAILRLEGSGTYCANT